MLFCGTLLLLNIVYSTRAERIGILVHGFNWKADGWEHVVLGNPGTKETGRSSHAIALVSKLLSLKENCIKCIYWGSGVKAANPLLEGEYTLKRQLTAFDELSVFPEFDGLSPTEFEILKKYIKTVSLTCHKSINTRTEIETAFEVFKEMNITQIILVSSPIHMPRCLRDASSYLLKKHSESQHSSAVHAIGQSGGQAHSNWNPVLLASPAKVCFPGTVMSDVVVVEPAHLPHGIDLERKLVAERLSLNMLVKRCFAITHESKQSFLTEFNDLLTRYNV